MFNAVCSRCKTFKPRCASVYFRVEGKATMYRHTPEPVCEDCRKELNGRYRLDERHR